MSFSSLTLHDAVASLPGKRILVCPLNWGLGHATRCIPIIKEIERQGKTAVVAAYGLSLKWIKQELPNHEVVEFPGVNVTYSKHRSQVGAMALALPRIMADIFREHRALEVVIREYKIDAVVSDNRFGLFTATVPCVYITHQLMVKMPKGLQWAEPLGHWLHGRFVKRYSACWVPDYANEPSLTADLSHRFSESDKVRFIGPLSRFQTVTIPTAEPQSDYQVLAVLSGPEPQRTLYEQALCQRLKREGAEALVVRGLPQDETVWKHDDNVHLVSHLKTSELLRLMVSVPTLYCRSGYTTLMDLAVLGRTAILTPTPGQTEQEYLAEVAKQRGFMVVKQQDLAGK